jgi:hypothetical protein
MNRNRKIDVAMNLARSGPNAGLAAMDLDYAVLD